MKILDSKMKATGKTEAAVIVTANPGCLLQMHWHFTRRINWPCPRGSFGGLPFGSGGFVIR